jgi:hypothetical protein
MNMSGTPLEKLAKLHALLRNIEKQEAEVNGKLKKRRS